MSFRSRRAAGERPLLDLLRSAIDSAGGKEVVGKALGGLLLDAIMPVQEEEPERQDVEGDTTYTPIVDTSDTTLLRLCMELAKAAAAHNLDVTIGLTPRVDDDE